MLGNARKCWNGRKVKLNAGKFFPNEVERGSYRTLVIALSL